MALKVIVLDFDGVVVESNNIKHHAFSQLFSEFSEYHDAIMAYHLSHHAVNRHEKFKYIMEYIFEQEYDKKLAEKWSAQFSALTRDRIIHCPYVKGACEFLEYFSREFPLYIVSATPLDELEIILKERGLPQYFKGVYGAPEKKTEILEQIIKKENILPREALFIGDSVEDYEAAKTMNISFVARLSGNGFNGYKVKKGKDLHEIKSFLLKQGRS